MLSDNEIHTIETDDGDWGDPPTEMVDTPPGPGYQPAYLSDRHFYRVVVWSLAGVVFVSLIGSIVLVCLGREIEASIIALGSTAVGALAGVIARGRS